MKNVQSEEYGITYKQLTQLISLCREFQPFMPFEELAFLDLVSASKIFCDAGVYGAFDNKERRFKELLIGKYVTEIKSKYYFNGFKRNNRPLSRDQTKKIVNYSTRVRATVFGYNDMRTYKPIEDVLFVKIVRACRDFMRSKMSKEAEAIFFEKLNIVYDALNQKYN